MKLPSLLSCLAVSIALTACGGGDSSTSTTTTSTVTPVPTTITGQTVTITSNGTSTPAPAAATFDVACSAGSHSFSSTNSTIANANMSLSNGSISVSFKTPATALTVSICGVPAGQAGFPDVPASLTPILKGTPVAAVLGNGNIAALSAKQVVIGYDFGTLGADAIAAKTLVSYTLVNGVWVRTVLATQQAAGSTASTKMLTASFDTFGFFTVE